MNRSSLRKIWGDLITRKGRTFLVSVSIFIGVVGVITMITAGDLLVTQLEKDIQESELPMLQALVTLPPSESAPLDNAAYLEALNQLPEVQRVEGQANYVFFWKLPDEGRFRESRMMAFSEPFGQIQIQPPRLIEGNYPESGQKQLMIELRMSEEFGLAIGDSIEVRILGTETDTLTVESWSIVGIIFHAYSQQPQESVYANYEDAAYITGIEGLSGILARYTDFPTAEANHTAFDAAIADLTPYLSIFSLAEDPAENQAIKSTQQFTQLLSALAIVAMLVSGFLVINVITNLVVEQRKQIGVMKSLGTTRWETFVMYAGIALVYGLLGVIPGVIVGIPLGYEMAALIGDFANTLIDEFAISPTAVILGVGLGLAVPIGAAVIPVFNGTRVTILEAMTDLGLSSGRKPGFLTRMVRALPLPMNIRMSLVNITQKKARLALTVITLMMAVTAFMGVSAIFIQINTALQNLLETFQFDIQLQPTESQSYEEVRNLVLTNIPEADNVFPGTGMAVQLEGYVSPFTNTSQMIVTGIDPAAPLLKLDLIEGDAWNNDPTRQGVVFTSEVTDQLGKGLGDTVTFTLGDEKLELEIIGIAAFPFDLGFMEWRQLASFAGYTEGAPTPNEYFTQLPVTDYAGTLPDGAVTAWGIDEQTAAFLTLTDGTASSAADQVLVSEAFATSSGLAVGDPLPITAETPYTISGIFTLPPQLTQAQLPADMVAFEWRSLAALEGRTLTGEPAPNVFFITLKEDDLTAREVNDAIDAIDDLLVSNGITASYQNQVELTDQASQAILSIGVILNMASLVMAAVGAIGLFTTLSISVFERQKEIGVMRSVGAKSPVIIIQFLVEGLLVGVIAWIIAAPLSVALSYGLMQLLSLGDLLSFAYPPTILVAGLIGILVVATFSSIWPSVSAARKTVSDILRYQ